MAPSLKCPRCGNPLTPPPAANIHASGIGRMRLECQTSGCTLYGSRRTVEEWETGAIPSRPTWDEQFSEMAALVARRGTCDRSQVGCVIAVRNRVVATGYNGSIAGAPHCAEVGHRMEGSSCVRTVHAEANAIADAARRGVSVEGGTAYLTRIPCINCAKLLISAGVVRVVSAVAYRDPESVRWIFEDARVRLEHP